MGKVAQDIDVLKKAQALDGEIYTALQALEDIPEERTKLKGELESEKARLHDLEGEYKKAQLTQKEKEGNLSEKENQIKKLEGQLSQVKKNEEYTILLQEIGSLKADNSILEEDIIKIFDEVEAAHEEVSKENERLKQCEKEFQARESELAQKEKNFKEQIGKQKQERDGIIQGLDVDARSLYERILEKKKGLALIKINGENCGACQIKLRAQIVNEVMLGENLVVCENCSRILYYEA